MIYLRLLFIWAGMLAVAIIGRGIKRKNVPDIVFGIVSILVFVMDWFLY